MRKIFVPITTRIIAREDKNKIVEQLEIMGAEYVFIGCGSYKINSEKRKTEMNNLKEYIDFFRSKGFKAAVWLWSFLIPEEVPYQRMVGITGNMSKTEVCPLDEGFLKFSGEYLKEIAGYVKPDMIIFDDDFGLAHEQAGIDIECVCPTHLARISEVVGEKLELDGLAEKLFTGERNKYRDAYIQVMRDTLVGFADKMREAVDSVNPSVRIGVCSLMSAWSTDGVDSYEIAQHLAGKNTRPFVRLIGAPYWAVDKLFGNNRLQDVINIQRMEASWRYGDVEIMYEGDVYPRPRFSTPANFLEAFDMALLADGGADGILKYVIDYTATSKYEQGYIERHLRNKPNYDWIMENMTNKPDVGVRVYEFIHTIKTARLPEKYLGYDYIRSRFMSPASKMMSACSVPITYRGDGCCGIAFGENVRYLTDEQIKNGLITDIEGARILAERGIDTGIRGYGDCFKPNMEHYQKEDEYVAIRNADSCVPGADVVVQKIELDDKAEIQSSFICKGDIIPASFVFENADGVKLLIFTFDAYSCDESFYRKYTRSRQIIDAVEHLSGKKLPAAISGNPDLYVITKQDDTSLSVGLWNLFPDDVFSPKIKLDGEYKSIECCSCSGELKGDYVELSDIKPYGFAGFVVNK